MPATRAVEPSGPRCAIASNGTEAAKSSRKKNATPRGLTRRTAAGAAAPVRVEAGNGADITRRSLVEDEIGCVHRRMVIRSRVVRARAIRLAGQPAVGRVE